MNVLNSQSFTHHEAEVNTIAHVSGQHLQDKENQKLSKHLDLIWLYFTPRGHKTSQCNICNKSFRTRILICLKKHLIAHHFHIIEEKRKKIKCTDLAPYFRFDVGDLETRCVVNNCKINILYEIAVLRDHLYKCRKASESAQKDDTDVMQQLVTEEHNTNTNDDQQSDAQAIESQKELPCNFDNNVIWQYFSPQTESSVKCNICHKHYNDESILNLELHLVSTHLEIIEEIREELKRSDISSYFVFDVGYCQTKCIYNKCNDVINIFHGVNGLREHLYKCHNKGEYIKAFESTQSNSVTDVIIQQSEIEEDNKNTDTDEQQSSESSEHSEDTECEEDNKNTNTDEQQSSESSEHSEDTECEEDNKNTNTDEQQSSESSEHSEDTECEEDNKNTNTDEQQSSESSEHSEDTECEEDNKNTNTDEQQSSESSEHSEDTEYQEESWENYHGSCKLMWKYFTKQEKSFVKCNICNKHYKYDNKKLKRHMSYRHPEIIEEIRKKVTSSYLSPYFKFDVKYSQTRCIFNNCLINIFCGINGLTKHLIIHHKINKSILQGVLKVVTPET